MDKVFLIFLLAVGLTSVVMRAMPSREINSGGCGPRALHAAALALGPTLSVRQTLDFFPNHGFEVALSQMESAGPKLGLTAHSGQMSLTDLKREKPIGVLHIDDTHFVAVVGYEQDSLFIVDSLYKGETKPVRWLYDDLKTRWDGAILVLSRE